MKRVVRDALPLPPWAPGLEELVNSTKAAAIVPPEGLRPANSQPVHSVGAA